jgi:hypothetical protein
MWLFRSWMDAVKFNLDVQSVVAMRLMKIAAGGATGAESTKMVQEKAEASVAALTAGAVALAAVGSVCVAARSPRCGQRKRVTS